MKIHKIEDERLGTVQRALNEAIVNLYHGNEKIAQDLVQKAISNLVTSGPTHEDRWELAWLPVDTAQSEKPDFIPQAVWPMVRVRTLWAYDSSVTTHTCSAEKTHLAYPLGVSAASIEEGNPECDSYLNAILNNGDWAQFWERLEEYADDEMAGETHDYYSKSYLGKHTSKPNRWLEAKCQEGWEEYQEDSPGVDFGDDDTRTEHIVRFMSQWFRDAEPWTY